MVKAGAFGRPDYFDDLVASVDDMTRGNDWFLLGEAAPLGGQGVLVKPCWRYDWPRRLHL